MRIQELLEGGWDTTVTQGTVIKPATVKTTLVQRGSHGILCS